MRIFPTAKFERDYKQLPDLLKEKAEIALEIFKANPSEPRLRTHKLHGRFAGYWAFTVAFDCRIIVRYGKTDEIFLIAIGNHGMYD